MKRINLSLISLVVSVLIIVAVAAVVFLNFDETKQADRQTDMIEDSVMSTVAQCYALEGKYPDNLEYLQENYGLQLDTELYIYHYEKFASNILPDVRVFERPEWSEESNAQ